ncbi:hypothetical protein D3C72_2247260 [compost metagenome]
MRSWIGDTTELGSVVSVVQDSMTMPSGPSQRSQRPAKAKGERSFIEKYMGCFLPLTVFHS